MGEIIEHNCGFAVAHTLHNAYNFAKSLQHRGREAAGIAAIGNDRIDVIKWIGLVEAFDLEDLLDLFPLGSDYHSYMIHVRYATRGRKDRILEDAHPHVIGGKVVHKGDHIFIYDCDAAIVENGQTEISLLEDSINKEFLQTECDTEAILHYYMRKGEEELVRQVPGSYTLAIADKRKKSIIVIRDRNGFKPGVLALKDGKHVVLSEDVAAHKNDAEVREHLEPGIIYYLSPDGAYIRYKVDIPEESSNLCMCMFEGNYIAHRESEIFKGIPVGTLRSYLGEEIAQEYGRLNVNIATYSPRCPWPAAWAYHLKTGVPYDNIFYKKRGERSFLGSTPEDRKKSIDNNLNINPEKKEKIKGLSLMVIDDSTIRATVVRRVIQLCEEAGVKSLEYVNYTPPIGIIKNKIQRGCMYGVDMPPDDDFIARNRTEEDISEYLIETTKTKIKFNMHYLSIDGMFRAYERLGFKRDQFCYFCIGGPKTF